MLIPLVWTLDHFSILYLAAIEVFPVLVRFCNWISGYLSIQRLALGARVLCRLHRLESSVMLYAIPSPSNSATIVMLKSLDMRKPISLDPLSRQNDKLWIAGITENLLFWLMTMVKQSSEIICS